MLGPLPDQGTVQPDILFTLEAFKSRLKISNATLRSARRAGLRVHYRHGRGFILGRDWIDYVTGPSGVERPSATAYGGT